MRGISTSSKTTNGRRVSNDNDDDDNYDYDTRVPRDEVWQRKLAAKNRHCGTSALTIEIKVEIR